MKKTNGEICIWKELSSIYIMWLRHVKRFLRTKARIFGSIIQPALFMTAFGLGIGRNSMVDASTTLSYFDYLIPGLVGMSIIFGSVMAGISVIWDRQFGFLKEVLVAPVSRVTIVIGRAAGATTTSLIQATIIIILGMGFGVSMTCANVHYAIMFMILLSLFCVGLGLAFSSRIEDMESFQFLQNIFLMPMIFLSTAFIPLGNAPEWLRVILRINPISYAIDGIRYGLLSFSYFSIYVDFVVSVISAILLLLISSIGFNRMEL